MAVTVPLGPAVVNLTGVRAGDRNLISLTLTSKGTPYDLSGLAISAQARHKATDETPAVTAVITIPPDPTLGELTMAWPGDQVAASLAGKASWQGVWDLQIDDGESVVTLLAGSFTAVLDVTR
jgi:hypothetical protein